MSRALDTHTDFIPRHIGPSDADQAAMLAAIGSPSLDALIEEVVPPKIRSQAPLALPPSRSEADVLAELKQIAGRNKVFRNYIGQGYYGTQTPNVVLRNILENPAWYTAYTPYQPEISQGRLEALLNYQTMVADLTGLDISNASLLDESTAAAEAMTLARRGAKSQSPVFFISRHVHPQTIEVVRTRAEGLDIEIAIGDEAEGLPECFGVLLQYPHSTGSVADYRKLAEAAHAQGAVVAVATDLLALALLAAPGEWGADIAIGSAQRFGVPFGFGGPHAGFMACKDAFKRNMAGRLVGVSKDAQGNPAMRLALQTREQHIRRAKILPFIRAWAESGGGQTGEAVFRSYYETLNVRARTVAATAPFDYVLSPVAPVVAYNAEWAAPTNEVATTMHHIGYTLPYNMSEQPAASVNCGYTRAGLPIGLQIAGARFDDLGVLRVARAWERMRPAQHPWPQPPRAA